MLGGCLGAMVGGLAGGGLGGWIAYTMISDRVELPEVGNPPVPLFVLLQLYVVALGVPVLLGGAVGAVIGLVTGSLIGAVAFSKLELEAIPREMSQASDRESPAARLVWVNCAIYGLFGLGLFWIFIAALTLIPKEQKDAPIGIAFLILGALGVASAIMISKRIPGARILGIVFVLPGLLVIPYGTVLGLLLLYPICCKETGKYLAGEL